LGIKSTYPAAAGFFITCECDTKSRQRGSGAHPFCEFAPLTSPRRDDEAWKRLRIIEWYKKI
jgi:hypothetical protein